MREEENPATNMLSPIFLQVMEKLVEASNRDDWQESNLRVGAYEAINKMIENCATDCDALVLQIQPLVMGRLEATLQVRRESGERGAGSGER